MEIIFIMIIESSAYGNIKIKINNGVADQIGVQYLKAQLSLLTGFESASQPSN